MAEELPLSEDTGASSLIEGRLVLPKDELNPTLLPARPEAFNPYFDVVGNSLVGSDPVYKQPDAQEPDTSVNFLNSIVEKAKNTAPEVNPYYAMKPYTYSGDMDNNLFERYHSSGEVYDKLGFSPYRNNEELYNKNMTLGDEFVRAAKQWDDLVGVGFMSGIRSWETIFTDPLAPDMQGAKDMEHIMNVGSSGKGGVGGFFVNTFLNSGYTVGVGMDFLGEELVLMGATAATGGAGGGAMIGKGLSAVNKLFNIGEKTKTGAQLTGAAVDILKAEKDINNLSGVKAIGNNFNDARGFWNKVNKGATTALRTTADILNPLDNTVAALKATDYATNYAKTVKTFGAFADDLLMIKGAVSEAKLEGGMVKMDATEKLINEYRNDKVRNPEGKLPEGEELKKIEKIAQDEATKTAYWNLPAIITSNKLMYATMLAPLRRIMGREVQELIPAIVLENKAFREVGEGVMDRAKVAAKSLRKPKIYGQYGMNYLKANLAEGVQENIQESISAGAIDEAMALYKDPIRASYEGYMPHFMRHLNNQLSSQGFETFAGGFVMGMFAQPVMAVPSLGISKLLNATVNRESIERFKEERKKDLYGYDREDGTHVMGTLEYLNDMIKDEKGNVNLDYLAPDLINAVRTGRLANDMFSAARIGDKMGAINSRGALQNHHLLTAIKTGKLDTILERLKDYKNLSKDEAKEAFAKYGITEEEDVAKALSHIDGIVERAKNLQETYQDSASKYPNPINPREFRNDPVKYRAALISKQAWDDAVYQLVFAKATFEDYSKRIADMANTFAGISQSIAKEDSQSIMALLGSQSMTDEINLLRREISILDETDAEQKKRKKDKEERLERIQEFYDNLVETKNAKTEDEKKLSHERAKESFGKYVQHLAKKKGNIVFNDSINAGYDIIRDHLFLKDDLAGLAQTINVLMTPKSFMAVQEKMLRAYSFMFSDKAMSDTLALNAEQFGFLKDIKDIASEITAKTKLIIPNEILEESAEAFRDGTAWPKPTYFIDATDGATEVTEGDNFDEALRMWNVFVALQKPSAQETISTSFVREDISTYPADLLELLRIPYDQLTEEEKALKSFEEFVLEPERAPIINKYFDDFAELNLDIPTEWKDLNLEELKLVQSKLLEEAETDSSLDPKLRTLEDLIAVKTMKESDMTPEKKNALRRLEAITRAAEGVEKNKEGYWVNGAYTDLRITNLVYDIILPQKYDKDKTPFTEKGKNKVILNYARKVFEAGNDRQLDSASIINNWVNFVRNIDAFKSRFDDEKIEAIKEEMGDDTSFDKFKSLLDTYAFKESTKAGNTVDELVRSFITYGTMKKPDTMSVEAFNSLRDSLHNLMRELKDKGETILAKNLIVDGIVTVDGKRKTIGGEMDLVVITPNGELKIYDIKTGKKGKYDADAKRTKAGAWDFYGTDDDDYQKKRSYELQLSLYAELLENATGLKVNKDELRIVPFEVDIDLNGYIRTLELKDEPKNTELDYNPIVKEYVVATKRGQQASSTVTPEVMAQKKAMRKGEVRDVRRALPSTIEALQDQEVEWQGKIGTIRIYGPDNVVFETENVEYQIELVVDGKDEGILANPASLGFQGIITKEIFAAPTEKKYDIDVQDELNVTVNGMSYYINLDSKGNIESLSPVNNPDQKIKNERLIVAVEIERNKLEYNTPDDIIEEVLELKGPNTTLTVIEGIYSESMTPEIAEALDKLYNGSKMSKLEKELVELWTYDAQKNLENLLNREGYKNNEDIISAIDNLKNITNILYAEQYAKKQKRKASTEEAPVSGTTKKGKRTITAASASKQAKEVESKEKLLVTNRPSDEAKKAREKVIKELLPKLIPPAILSKVPAEKVLSKLLSTRDFNHFINSINFTEGIKIYPEELGDNLNDIYDTYIKNWGSIKETVYNALMNYREAAVSQEETKPVEVPRDTIEDLNKALDKESFAIAKKRKYEVIYNNINHRITKVGKNSVSLKAPNMDTVTLPYEEAFSLTEIVEPGGIKDTNESNETIKNNEPIVSQEEKSFTVKPIDEAFNNVINAALKC